MQQSSMLFSMTSCLLDRIFIPHSEKKSRPATFLAIWAGFFISGAWRSNLDTPAVEAVSRFETCLPDGLDTLAEVIEDMAPLDTASGR